MHKHSLTLTILMLAISLGVLTTPVQAEDTFEQNQLQEFEIECETGSYGQITKCTAEGKQEQGQKIIYRDRDGKPAHAIYRDGRRVHIPVDTSVDSRVYLALFAVILGAALMAALTSGKVAK